MALRVAYARNGGDYGQRAEEFDKICEEEG
jgi:hypothetical protein